MSSSRDIFKKRKSRKKSKSSDKRKKSKKSKSVTFKTIDNALYSQAHNSVIANSSDYDSHSNSDLNSNDEYLDHIREKLQNNKTDSDSLTDNESPVHSGSSSRYHQRRHERAVKSNSISKPKRKRKKSDDSISTQSNQDGTMSWFKKVNSAFGNLLVSKQPSELNMSEIDELTENHRKKKSKNSDEIERASKSKKRDKKRKHSNQKQNQVEIMDKETIDVDTVSQDVDAINKRSKLVLSGGRLCTSVLSASGIPSQLTGKYRWYRVTDGEMSRIDTNNDSTYHPHLNDVGCKIYCQWIPTGIHRDSRSTVTNTSRFINAKASNFAQCGPILMDGQLEKRVLDILREDDSRKNGSGGTQFRVNMPNVSSMPQFIVVNRNGIQVTPVNISGIATRSSANQSFFINFAKHMRIVFDDNFSSKFNLVDDEGNEYGQCMYLQSSLLKHCTSTSNLHICIYCISIL